jgi:hypothetical protein
MLPSGMGQEADKRSRKVSFKTEDPSNEEDSKKEGPKADIVHISLQ